ncbi:MAG: hypothetical protein ABEH78_04400 [Haloferacaceae archaeon]
MTPGSSSPHVRLELGESTEVDELVLAFRSDRTLHELASLTPPATATLSSDDRLAPEDPR